jgi:hypothetical protein
MGIEVNLNPNHEEEKAADIKALAEATTPENKRFSKEIIEKFIALLGDGYEIRSFNEFSGGNYSTKLEKDGAKEILSSEYPWPFVLELSKSDKKETLVKKELEKMKMGLGKN